MGWSSSHPHHKNSIFIDFCSDDHLIILFVFYDDNGKRCIVSAKLFQLKSQMINLTIKLIQFEISTHFENMFFFSIRMPFSRKTAIGYSVIFAIQMVFLLICSQASVCLMGFLIGYFKIITTFGKDIQRKISNFNENFDFWKRTNVKNEFCGTIRLHSEVKEFSLFDILTLNIFYMI